MATASQNRGRSRARPASERGGPALVDDLLAMAGSLASSRKEYAAEQLESLADSVRQFGESIPAVPTVRAYAMTAADSLEGLAGYVVESELADIMADAREFTRRHPLVTFGGSIAAGIVITQVVQSRAQQVRSGSAARRQRSGPARGRAAPRRADEEPAEEME